MSSSKQADTWRLWMRYAQEDLQIAESLLDRTASVPAHDAVESARIVWESVRSDLYQFNRS